MAKVRQKQRQTNTTRFLEAPFVRMLRMRSASLKIPFFRVHSLLYILFEKENMNGHAVTRIYFLYAYILMEKLNPQLDLLRTPA